MITEKRANQIYDDLYECREVTTCEKIDLAVWCRSELVKVLDDSEPNPFYALGLYYMCNRVRGTGVRAVTKILDGEWEG